MLFTTSWDDGYTLDLRIADLLDRYNLTGTFYVCPKKQHGCEMLSEEEVRSIANCHEIGAHTLRHPRLTMLSDIEAKTEVEDSKAWVERIVQKPCTMFCYPYGVYDDRIKNIVASAGFNGARTTEHMHFGGSDPFAMPTTLQVCPFPKRKVWSRWWHPLDIYGPRRVRTRSLKQLGIDPKHLTSWLDLAKALLDKGLELEKDKENSFLFPLSSFHFHLWGHSQEVERYGMWEELEQFLAYVKEKNVVAATNSEILEKQDGGVARHGG